MTRRRRVRERKWRNKERRGMRSIRWAFGPDSWVYHTEPPVPRYRFGQRRRPAFERMIHTAHHIAKHLATPCAPARTP